MLAKYQCYNMDKTYSLVTGLRSSAQGSAVLPQVLQGLATGLATLLSLILHRLLVNRLVSHKTATLIVVPLILVILALSLLLTLLYLIIPLLLLLVLVSTFSDTICGLFNTRLITGTLHIRSTTTVASWKWSLINTLVAANLIVIVIGAATTSKFLITLDHIVKTIALVVHIKSLEVVNDIRLREIMKGDQ